jgi:protein SCO1
MNSGTRLVQWIVGCLMALVVVSIAGVFVSRLLLPGAKPLPVYGQLSDFKLTNEVGRVVSLADLKGHIWIADVIFTRCAGSCPVMTRKMKSIQAQLPPDSPVKLISLTADPAFDTPPVLKTYAARFNANLKNWDFLTGPKRAIYDLATKGLKLAVQENDTTNVSEMFIHSTRIVLVDGRGRLRAVGFDGTDAQAVPQVLQAVDQLVRESRS